MIPPEGLGVGEKTSRDLLRQNWSSKARMSNEGTRDPGRKNPKGLRRSDAKGIHHVPSDSDIGHARKEHLRENQTDFGFTNQ